MQKMRDFLIHFPLLDLVCYAYGTLVPEKFASSTKNFLYRSRRSQISSGCGQDTWRIFKEKISPRTTPNQCTHETHPISLTFTLKLDQYCISVFGIGIIHLDTEELKYVCFYHLHLLVRHNNRDF